jgi:hypothetical protein
MTNIPAERNPGQVIAIENFASLSKVMSLKMQQHYDLADKRKVAVAAARDVGVSAKDLADAAGISVQAVYKLFKDADRQVAGTE